MNCKEKVKKVLSLLGDKLEKESSSIKERWTSPIPEERWKGFRRLHRGVEAFKSLENFEKACLSELDMSLEDHEKKSVARLIHMGKKDELEIFIRTHGVNPISDPHAPINVPIHVAKADMVNLSEPPSREAVQAILNGDVVYMLFQAGEATRFNRGPLFSLDLVAAAKEFQTELNVTDLINEIETKAKKLDPKVASFLMHAGLGPKQAFFIRAGLRRLIQTQVSENKIAASDASHQFAMALLNQKFLFFIPQKNNVSEVHDEALRSTYKFYGFNPENMVTVQQESVMGITAKEEGTLSFTEDPEAKDAAGHLYAFLQAARPNDFTTYSPSGRPIKPMGQDALSYLLQRGGKYLSVIRINDMDRLTTEVVNAKALSYAMSQFEKGYFNVIEGVANPSGQKGGTGTCFDNPEIHCLTETHENSYPALSRVFETAMKNYLKKHAGVHPAYNAMRQWADLQQTRTVLREFGGRIVFVPRSKKIKSKEVLYLGADMPMGDLSLFVGHYKSRMFQFVHKNGKELLIHDMKRGEDVPLALQTLIKQMEDPFVLAAAKEFILGIEVPYDPQLKFDSVYGAPTPEFN